MAANVSVIGRTTRVRGRVTGTTDLEVQGFVEGEIQVTGDVLIDSQGMVGAGVQGRRLVVRGAVRGDLVGQEAVALEDGARVVGDVRAPRVAIAPGALVRGFVETEKPSDGGRAARAQAQNRAAPPAASRPAAGAVRPPSTATAAAAAPPRSPSVTRPAATGSASNHSAADVAARRPPPPVVPTLKKVKGQIAKRRER